MAPGAFFITTETSQVVGGAGFLFRNSSLEDMTLNPSVSHLFRPLVHSRPLRTVIKVEQYVLTASRLQRGKHTERRDQRGGRETVCNSYEKNCFQSLKGMKGKQVTRYRKAERKNKRDTSKGRRRGIE